jgi:hypothetical protein
MIKLELQGNHAVKKHVQDKVTKKLTLPQSTAIQLVIAINPMPAQPQCGAALLSDEVSKIYPTKQCLVQHTVAKAQGPG